MATDSERGTTTWADVELDDVMRVSQSDPPSDPSVLMLKETGGDRLLPIWVGAFEGDSAAILSDGCRDASTAHVSVHGPQAVDARPSDAVALALVTRVPIRVERGLLDAACSTPPGAGGMNSPKSRPDGIRSARDASDAIRTRSLELRKSPTRSLLF